MLFSLITMMSRFRCCQLMMMRFRHGHAAYYALMIADAAMMIRLLLPFAFYFRRLSMRDAAMPLSW